MSDCLGVGTAVGGATQAGAAIYTAASQAQTNANNLAAQQQRQQLIQQYMNQYMTQSQSPYAQATMNFLSQGVAPGGGYQGNGYIQNTPPGTVTTGGPNNNTPNPYGSGTGQGGGGGSGANAPTGGVAGGSGDGTLATNVMPNIPALLAQYAATAPSAQVSQPAAAGATPGYDQGQAYYNALIAGGIPAAQAAQYSQQLGGGTSNGGGVPGFNYTLPSGQQTQVNGQGQLIAGAPAAGQPIYGPNGQLLGYSGQPGYQPTSPTGVPSTIPATYNTSDPSSTGGVVSYTPGQGQTYPGAPTGGAPSGGQSPTFGSSGSPNYGQQGSTLPSIYNYQQQNPFTYQAGQVGGTQQAQAFSAPQSVQSIGTQAYNPGQDGLLQMMNRQVQPTQDPALNSALRQGATQMPAFNTSPEEQSVNNLNMFNLQKQIDNLQGSAGSLGERFGTALGYNQGQLAANALTNNSAQLQQIAQSSFNTQQQNQLQAQGLDVANLQNFNQNQLAGQGQQLSAAQSAQQGGLTQQGYGVQAGLQAQNLGQSASQQAAQLGTQTSQYNAGNSLQALLANLQSYNQAGQFNASAGQTMSAQNAQQGNIFNNLMLSGTNQAASQQQSLTGSNTSLLGLLAGLSVPQQQVSPYGQAGSTIGQLATLYPFLAQLGQQQTTQPTTQAYGSGNPLN